MTTLTHLECGRCGAKYDPAILRAACDCGGSLLARYDLEMARTGWNREWVTNAPATMWRYAPVLPVRKPPSVVSLGEGMTPLLHSRRLGERLGLPNLWIKDEGRNPTASIEARGLSCAVSMAVELGAARLTIRSTSNAASALAAYASAAGIEAHLSLPPTTPSADYVQTRVHSAKILTATGDAYDLNGPYRIEGLKTLGYEIVEQMSWALPDVILFPDPEGLNRIALAKAFEELEQLGWTAAARPRLIPVQTGASIQAALELAAAEGVFAAPGAASGIAALHKLIEDGELKPGDRIVVVVTTSGLKHLDVFATRFPAPAATEHDKLGGLITPR